MTTIVDGCDDIMHIIWSYLSDTELFLFKFVCEAWMKIHRYRSANPSRDINKYGINRYIGIIPFLFDYGYVMPAKIVGTHLVMTPRLKTIIKLNDYIVWSAELYRYIIRWRRFDILKYGYSCDSNACYRPILFLQAACTVDGPDMKIIRFLHAHGCEWDDTVCETAILIRSTEVFTFLIENGGPWNSQLCGIAACHEDDTVYLKIAVDHNLPLYETGVIASMIHQSDIVFKYLIRHDAPVTTESFVAAIKNLRLDRLRVLYEMGYPVNMYKCYDIAQRYGSAEIIAYIEEIKKGWYPGRDDESDCVVS